MKTLNEKLEKNNKSREKHEDKLAGRLPEMTRGRDGESRGPRVFTEMKDAGAEVFGAPIAALTELKNSTAKNELYLDFLGECWIELYVGDELIEALYFYENDNYKKKIEIPFKIVVGNAEAIKGTYNGNEIDFMANANRLTKVNIINFDENKLD